MFDFFFELSVCEQLLKKGKIDNPKYQIVCRVRILLTYYLIKCRDDNSFNIAGNICIDETPCIILRRFSMENYTTGIAFMQCTENLK
jgi:hypothetical protein